MVFFSPIGTHFSIAYLFFLFFLKKKIVCVVANLNNKYLQKSCKSLGSLVPETWHIQTMDYVELIFSFNGFSYVTQITFEIGLGISMVNWIEIKIFAKTCRSLILLNSIKHLNYLYPSQLPCSPPLNLASRLRAAGWRTVSPHLSAKHQMCLGCATPVLSFLSLMSSRECSNTIIFLQNSPKIP